MRIQTDIDLNQLNRRYRPALMSFFLRRLRNHAEAEDLTQEVFAKLATIDRGAMQHADAYIFQTAANLLRDRGRREKVREEYRAAARLFGHGDVEALDPSRVAAGREALASVAGALRELPERTRDIFILYRLENLQRAEIAATYGITVSGVQKHLSKAMAHLINRVGEGA